MTRGMGINGMLMARDGDGDGDVDTEAIGLRPKPYGQGGPNPPADPTWLASCAAESCAVGSPTASGGRRMDSAETLPERTSPMPRNGKVWAPPEEGGADSIKGSKPCRGGDEEIGG